MVADIEAISGCWKFRASSFFTEPWSRACVEMSRDVNAAVEALFFAEGVKWISVRDFHRRYPRR